jgi:signal transduction histidine kinase/CheY-like chemotaxis protein
VTFARPNNINYLLLDKHIAVGLMLFCAFVGTARGQRHQPEEVTKRRESGEMKQVRQLLMDVNPEYARLSFSDALNPTAKDVRGWESWWSSDRARFFVYRRNSMDESGYLYLDGATNWLVHDLKSMKDISLGKTEDFNYGAYPTVFKERFHLVGGYGHFRFNRNWLGFQGRGFGYAAYRSTTRGLRESYLEPPNVVHGFWRDEERQAYFMLANSWVYDEPNNPPPRTDLLSDSLRGGLRQFQLWQAPDTGLKEYTHIGDFNPDIFGQIPLAVLESESWVIFIRENTLSTPMMRKSDFAWFELKADYQLPFGDKNGLYGWMFQGDSLMVVNEGTIAEVIDLTAHVDKYKSEQPQFVEARNELVLPPIQLDYTKEVPVDSTPWGWPVAVVAVGLVFATLALRKKRGEAESQLSDMNAQLEIIEYFSRSIFRSNSADDILWDIAAQCISRLDFEDCVIYMLDDTESHWIQKAAYGPKNIDYREIHEPVTLGISEGIVGAVGLSGQAEIIADVRKDTRYVVDDAQRLSEMAVPIICDGKVIGVIDSEHSKANFYTRDHLKIIQNVANICGQKLGRSLSEQKTLEFIQVYEQNPDPVLRINHDGVVVMTNDSAKAHFGRNALQGERVKLTDLDELVRESIQSGQSAVSSVQNGGRIYQVHILPDHSKKHVDVYSTDVTDLERAKTRAEKAERAKAEFLSIMSHEIRTPLNAIMGINELMLKDKLDDNQLRQLKYMQYSGKHLLGLVNDILNLSSLDHGEVERKSHNFNLTELLNSLVESHQPQAKEQGSSIALNLPAEPNAWVQGDRHWVTQMVANLLDNAVKFTKRGTITLSARSLPGEDTWRIDVEDTGIGIPEEHLGRIMDPFEQVLNDPKNTNPNQGTGLGLAIVKRLATLHGGLLSVQSTEGIGSKFTLELDLPEGTVQANEKATSVKEPLDRDGGIIERAKVLVVDDNPMNLLVAQKLIEKLGHEVVTSTNGEEAIQAWLAEEPEMIFMDLQMPVMDGMEATQEIRRRMEGRSPYFLSIVALTADAEASTRRKALASGLNDVLVKPASIDQLEHSIQHWCRLHREALA